MYKILFKTYYDIHEFLEKTITIWKRITRDFLIK